MSIKHRVERIATGEKQILQIGSGKETASRYAYLRSYYFPRPDITADNFSRTLIC